MSGAFSIRPAVEQDLETITVIYADAVEHGTASYELDPPDLHEMTRRWRTLTEQGYPYFVAERDGRIIGYAYAGPYRSRPAYRFTVENTVYIVAEARRRGIGRQLLQAVIDDCERKGFRQIIAIISDGAHHAASVGLHAALGFRRIGVVEGSGYKHGRWLDTVLMQRQLGEGNSSPPVKTVRSQASA